MHHLPIGTLRWYLVNFRPGYQDPSTGHKSAVHRRATVFDPSRKFLLKRHWESCAYANHVRTFLRVVIGGRPFRARPTLRLRQDSAVRHGGQGVASTQSTTARVRVLSSRSFVGGDAGLEWIEPKTGAKSKMNLSSGFSYIRAITTMEESTASLQPHRPSTRRQCCKDPQRSRSGRP
jgi:hypothetical protein